MKIEYKVLISPSFHVLVNHPQLLELWETKLNEYGALGFKVIYVYIETHLLMREVCNDDAGDRIAEACRIAIAANTRIDFENNNACVECRWAAGSHHESCSLKSK